MTIREVKDVNIILPLHKEIFGMDFPMESYYKKKKKYNLLIYVYDEDSMLLGYSIVVDQADEKNLYAWYGGVLPEEQGKGITRNFFDWLIQLAEEKCYDSVTVATSNLRPHMLVLAIKRGFDIVDVKRRVEGEGNKIYFKYKICPPTSVGINLVENGKNVKPVEVEKKIVNAYKSNCKQYCFKGIKNFETMKYAINYMNSLGIKAEVFITEPIDKEKYSYLKSAYLGLITTE